MSSRTPIFFCISCSSKIQDGHMPHSLLYIEQSALSLVLADYLQWRSCLHCVCMSTTSSHSWTCSHSNWCTTENSCAIEEQHQLVTHASHTIQNSHSRENTVRSSPQSHWPQPMHVEICWGAHGDGDGGGDGDVEKEEEEVVVRWQSTQHNTTQHTHTHTHTHNILTLDGTRVWLLHSQISSSPFPSEHRVE